MAAVRDGLPETKRACHTSGKWCCCLDGNYPDGPCANLSALTKHSEAKVPSWLMTARKIPFSMSTERSACNVDAVTQVNKPHYKEDNQVNELSVHRPFPVSSWCSGTVIAHTSGDRCVHREEVHSGCILIINLGCMSIISFTMTSVWSQYEVMGWKRRVLLVRLPLCLVSIHTV